MIMAALVSESFQKDEYTFSHTHTHFVVHAQQIYYSSTMFALLTLAKVAIYISSTQTLTHSLTHSPDAQSPLQTNEPFPVHACLQNPRRMYNNKYIQSSSIVNYNGILQCYYRAL